MQASGSGEDLGGISGIVVMGVSGSGKSTIAAELAERLGWVFADGDAFHSPGSVAKMHRGTPLDDDDRRPWLAAIAAWLTARESLGQPGVVACSALKRAYREVLLKGRPAARLVYLKGSEELIARRLQARLHHFMPAGLLQSQFAALEEPGLDEHPVVVDIDVAPDAVVGAIVRQLAGHASR